MQQPAQGPGAGSVVLNIIWVVLSGFWMMLGYAVAGLLWCITIIGIPFGVQSFKLAGFALWPFGRMVVKRPGSGGLNVVLNLLWVIFSGLWLAIGHVVTGAVLCLTIIGIPLGIANFKLVPLALWPFGRQVVVKGSAPDITVAF
jgi:uncharacterized membrane protein YccF (DUF307 family)